MGQNIGFISTRFAGTDGVTLESAKWAKVLWDHKHRSFWFAGQLDRDPGASMLAPQAWFGDTDVAYINRHVYGCVTRRPDITRLINSLADHLKHQITHFVNKFEIGILVVQNAITIPMNIPLGVAITKFVAESGFPTIAHHHDF